MKHIIVALVILASVLGTAGAGRAVLLFQTATGNQLNSAMAIDDLFWALHRFQLTTPAHLDSVGGFFSNFNTGNVKIFGAVVALTGPTDRPNSFDLSTSDVLGTTLITVGLTDGDYLGTLSLNLPTGWYALAFGTGKFGADSLSVFGIDILMPSLANDLSAQLPFTDVLPGNPFNTPQFIDSQVTPRFFANGTPIIVDGIPEPNVLTLLGVGLAAISLLWRWT